MFSKGVAVEGAAAGAAGSVTRADANKLVNPLLIKAGGVIPSVRFNIVNATGELPEKVITDNGGTRDNPGVITGAFSRNVVHVVLDANKSLEDLEQMVFHEL